MDNLVYSPQLHVLLFLYWGDVCAYVSQLSLLLLLCLCLWPLLLLLLLLLISASSWPRRAT